MEAMFIYMSRTKLNTNVPHRIDACKMFPIAVTLLSLIMNFMKREENKRQKKQLMVANRKNKTSLIRLTFGILTYLNRT